MKETKNPKRPLIYYYLIAMLALLLINAFLAPMLQKSRVQEVSYDTFLSMVSEGKVKEVEMDDSQIAFSPSDESDRSIYITGVWDDPGLTETLNAAGVSYGRVIPQEASPLQSFIFGVLLPVVGIVLIGQLIGRMLTKRMGGANAMSFGKSNAKIYVEAKTGKTFADVAGQDEAKGALTEIVDFLHDPGKYREIGAKLPKGALLVGPPGTGKTLLAQAVAGEAGVPFFSISGSEFVEMFVGMGAARVRDLFKQAGEKAPCIVFIDEIDAIGKKRDNSGMGGNDEREQTLNQLLTEMDGFDAGKGVVILAATNRPETLDPALLRPGRFDRRIPVELPDLAGREAILKVHSKDVRIAPNADFNAVARATSGASGADLANIINEAALGAVKAGRKAVVQADLDEAVETVIAGYQRKNAVISTKDRLIVSYHECGHALVAALQKHSAPVHKITIVPRTSGALGYTMQVDEEEQVLMSRETILDKIATFTAGRAAEELIFGSVTSGASNDIEQATKLARAMVTQLGMTDEFDMTALANQQSAYLGGDASLVCSADTAARVDQKVVEIIREQHQKALGLLRENKAKLHELARELYERETLTGDEFMEILARPVPLPAAVEEAAAAPTSHTTSPAGQEETDA